MGAEPTAPHVLPVLCSSRRCTADVTPLVKQFMCRSCHRPFCEACLSRQRRCEECRNDFVYNSGPPSLASLASGNSSNSCFGSAQSTDNDPALETNPKMRASPVCEGRAPLRRSTRKRSRSAYVSSIPVGKGQLGIQSVFVLIFEANPNGEGIGRVPLCHVMTLGPHQAQQTGEAGTLNISTLFLAGQLSTPVRKVAI